MSTWNTDNFHFMFLWESGVNSISHDSCTLKMIFFFSDDCIRGYRKADFDLWRKVNNQSWKNSGFSFNLYNDAWLVFWELIFSTNNLLHLTSIYARNLYGYYSIPNTQARNCFKACCVTCVVTCYTLEWKCNLFLILNIRISHPFQEACGAVLEGCWCNHFEWYH